MDWIAAATASLVPLSEADHLSAALKEWRYHGTTYDQGQPVETCKLCGKNGIRFQFQIKNQFNRNTLLIGSECIKRFGIGAVSAFGQLLNREQTSQKLASDRRKMIDDAAKNRVIYALVQLDAADADLKLSVDDLIETVQDDGGFSPKQLFVLQWRLSIFNIEHQPSDFKMTIRRAKYQTQLKTMEDWKIDKLRPYMSQSQRDWCSKHL